MESKRRISILLKMAFLLSLGSLWPAQTTIAKPMISTVRPLRITQGDEITITGNFVGKENERGKGRVEVKIDDEPVGFVVEDAGKKIIVVVETDPGSKVEQKATGEYERQVVVVVDGESSEGYKIRQLHWRAIFQPHVFLVILGYILIVGLIIVHAGKRDDTSGADERDRKARTYFKVLRSESNELSLSKIQMMLWTVVFSFSYLVLSAIYWEFLDIKEGMFWLMGISSTTAVGAKAIVLRNRPKKSKPSKLLSDYDEGSKEYKLSLHRCQIAIWTLIVMALYLQQLFVSMRLPEIPTQLLLLMGISGGAYLGFNYPKPPSDEPAPPEAPPAQAPAGYPTPGPTRPEDVPPQDPGGYGPARKKNGPEGNS